MQTSTWRTCTLPEVQKKSPQHICEWIHSHAVRSRCSCAIGYKNHEKHSPSDNSCLVVGLMNMTLAVTCRHVPCHDVLIYLPFPFCQATNSARAKLNFYKRRYKALVARRSYATPEVVGRCHVRGHWASLCALQLASGPKTAPIACNEERVSRTNRFITSQSKPVGDQHTNSHNTVDPITDIRRHCSCKRASMSGQTCVAMLATLIALL